MNKSMFAAAFLLIAGGHLAMAQTTSTTVEPTDNVSLVVADTDNTDLLAPELAAEPAVALGWDGIPIEVEYQFLKLTSILASSIEAEEIAQLTQYASNDPAYQAVDHNLIAGAIDLSANQTALQSDPRLVVSAGLYLLSVGHSNDLQPRLDALIETDPRLTAFDLSLMEEAVLVRWNILDALQSIEVTAAPETFDTSLAENPAITGFERGTLDLHSDYRFAVFVDQVDRLSDEHLSRLEYTLRTYVLGISREVDQDTVTSSIRRVEDLNASAKEQANNTMARTLAAIFGYR